MLKELLNPSPQGASERISFTIQLKRLVVDAPSKLISHHSIYIKWQRGKSYRGKLPPVPCSAHVHVSQQQKPMVEIELPSTHQISFEVNVHSKVEPAHDTNGTASNWEVSMEKKVLDLTLSWFRFEDHTKVDLHSRQMLTHVSIDLRELLKDSRNGAVSTFLVPFGKGCSIDGVFVASAVQPRSPAGCDPLSKPSSSGKELSSCSGSSASDKKGLAEPVTDCPLAITILDSSVVAAVGADTAASTILHESESLLKQMVAASPNTAHTSQYFSHMDSIVEEGLFKAVVIPKTAYNDRSDVVAAVYERLLSDTRGKLQQCFHAARGDLEYGGRAFEYFARAKGQATIMGTGHLVRVALPPPTTSNRGTQSNLQSSTSEGSENIVGGVKIVPFSLRTTKDKHSPAFEVTSVCTLAGDVVAHSVVFAPSAPIVGDGLRVETVIHITRTASNCMVAQYIHIAVTSSKLRFLMGSKIQQQAEKTQKLLDRTVNQIVFSSNTSSSAKQQRTSFRSSLLRSSSAPSLSSQLSSLDPNLWRRLRDECTLPKADSVLQILKRLAPIVQQAKANVTLIADQIGILEDVIGYHRRHVPIVSAALQLMLMLCNRIHAISLEAKATSLVKATRTVASTVATVVELHPKGTFEAIDGTIKQLELLQQSSKATRQAECMVSKDYWGTLVACVGDGEAVEAILARLSTVSRVHTLQDPAHVQTLTTILSLHLSRLAVCEHVWRILERVPDLSACITPQFVLALHAAARLHDALTLKFPTVLHRVAEVEENFTPFQKQYGDVVREPLLFSCRVMVEEPYWGPKVLYITRSYVCLGDEILPITNMRRVEVFSSLLRPAVKLFMIATMSDYVLILLSRAKLLSVLRDLGCGWMIVTRE